MRAAARLQTKASTSWQCRWVKSDADGDASLSQSLRSGAFSLVRPAKIDSPATTVREDGITGIIFTTKSHFPDFVLDSFVSARLVLRCEKREGDWPRELFVGAMENADRTEMGQRVLALSFLGIKLKRLS